MRAKRPSVASPGGSVVNLGRGSAAARVVALLGVMRVGADCKWGTPSKDVEAALKTLDSKMLVIRLEMTVGDELASTWRAGAGMKSSARICSQAVGLCRSGLGWCRGWRSPIALPEAWKMRVKSGNYREARVAWC